LKHRYLLSPTVSAERFSEQVARPCAAREPRAVRDARGTALKAMIASDPTGELRSLAETAVRARPHPGTASGSRKTALARSLLRRPQPPD